MRLRTIIVAVATFLLAHPGTLWAETAEVSNRAETPGVRPTHARVLLPPCLSGHLSAEELIPRVRVELLGQGIALDSPINSTPPPTVVVITVDAETCESSELAVELSLSDSTARVSRRVVIDDTDAVDRSRVLALAISELLRDGWNELMAEEPPTPPDGDDGESDEPSVPLQPVVDVEAIERGAAERALAAFDERRRNGSILPRFVIDGQLDLRLHPTFGGTFLGVEVGASFRLSRAFPLRLALDGAYRYGGGEDDLGRVTVHTAALGVALEISGGTRSLTAVMGPRVDVGWLWAAGQSSDPEVVVGDLNGLTLTVAWQTTLLIRLSRVVRLVAELELGYAVVGQRVSAGDRLIGGIGGPLIGIGLGTAFQW